MNIKKLKKLIRLHGSLPPDGMINTKNLCIDSQYEALRDACERGSMVDVKKYFTLKYLNCQNPVGGTPIMGAALYGHIDIVKYLIEKGADLNILTSSGNNILQRAVHHGRLSIVEYLLTCKVDLNNVNNKRYTALDIAEENIRLKLNPEHGDPVVYEKIRTLLIARSASRKIGSQESMGVTILREVNPLSMIELREGIDCGKINDIDIRVLEAIINVLDSYIVGEIGELSSFDLSFNNDEVAQGRLKLENELLRTPYDGSFEEAQRYHDMYMKQSFNSTIICNYRQLARGCYCYLDVVREYFRKVLNNIKDLDQKNISISIIEPICERNEFLESLIRSRSIGPIYKTEFVLSEIGKDLSKGFIVFKDSLRILRNLVRQETELMRSICNSLEDMHFQGEKAQIIANILDSTPEGLIIDLSKLFQKFYNVSISDESIKNKLITINDTVPRYPESIRANICKIGLMIDSLAGIAPKEAVIDSATFVEKLLFQYIYIRFIDLKGKNEFKKYCKNTGLEFRNEKSLTIGFYIAWIELDTYSLSEFAKHPGNHAIDMIHAMKLVLSKINEKRNSVVHKRGDSELQSFCDENSANETYQQLLELAHVIHDLYV